MSAETYERLEFSLRCRKVHFLSSIPKINAETIFCVDDIDVTKKEYRHAVADGSLEGDRIAQVVNVISGNT